MTIRSRPTMPVGTKASWCTECGHHFYSTDAFDVHRGIKHNRRGVDAEEGLDADRCLSPAERSRAGLVVKGGRWFTAGDLTEYDKVLRAQAARGSR